MNTDPLADCFTRIRNGAKARKETVKMPYSKLKEQVLNVLRDEGFLTDLSVEEEGNKRKSLVARLKFERSGGAVLDAIKRVSKPGHRIYRKTPGTQRVREGLGFQILTTSQGIMTDRQASEKKIGGEVIAEVY